MICPKCGAQEADDARFCGACGAPLKTDAGPTGPKTGPADARPGSGVHSSLPPAHGSIDPATAEVIKPELKWGIAASTIIIPILPIVMGILYMVDATASPDKKAVGKLWIMAGVGGIVFWTVCSCIAAAMSGGY